MSRYTIKFAIRLALWLLGITCLIALIGLVAFRLGGFASAQKVETDGGLSEAQTLLAQGRYDQALAFFDRAVSLNRNRQSALMGRGICQLALDHPDRAEQDFRALLSMEPRSSDAIAHIGRARAMQGDHEGALAAFEKSLTINSNAAEVAYWKAGALLRLGKHAEAETAYSTALSINPLLLAAIADRGQARLKLGRHAEAFNDFKWALQSLPKSPGLWASAGLSLMALGRLAEADEYFTRAIKLDPKAATIYHNRGLARFGMGRTDDALKDIDIALGLNPKLARGLRLRGMILAKKDRHKEALSAFTEALQLDPSDAETHRLRATSARAIGDEALARQEEELSARPRQPGPGIDP